MCSVSWDPRDPNELLFTDASDFGLGAHLSNVTDNTVVSGLWSANDATKHVTFNELKVVQIALEAIGAHLKNKTVALFSDSSSTVSILQKLYTKSTSLRAVLNKIIVLLS